MNKYRLIMTDINLAIANTDYFRTGLSLIHQARPHSSFHFWLDWGSPFLKLNVKAWSTFAFPSVIH